MSKILLDIVMIAFIIWAIRRIIRQYRQMKNFPPKPQPRPRDREHFSPNGQGPAGQEPIDLVRDEKTGEYRVKDK